MDGIVTVGQEVTFTVHITNTGDSALTTLPLTETFGAGYLTFLDAQPAPTSSHSGQLIWENLTLNSPLAVGEAARVSIRYQALASTNLQAGQITEQNALVAGAANSGGDLAQPVQASAAVRITSPSLAVGKSLAGNNPFAIANAPITFTLRVTNTGDTQLNLIRVADVYSSSDLTFRSAQITPDQNSPGRAEWDDVTGALGDLLPGGQLEFTIGFTVTTAKSPVTNTLQAQLAVDQNGDPAALMIGQAQVDVAAIDLNFESVPPAGSNVRPSACIVYNLITTNPGGVDLTNTILTAEPSDGTTVVESCPDNSHARLPGPLAQTAQVQWNLGTLPRGGVESRQLRVVVNGDLTVPVIILRAHVRSDQTGDNASDSQIAHPLDPTAVTLLRFTARSQFNGVRLDWITGAEVNAWGFHLWRTESDRWLDGVRVSPVVIPAAGRDGSGATYTFFDPDGRKGHWYWLQEIESDGNLNLYGPVEVDSLTAGQPQQNLFLPMVGR